MASSLRLAFSNNGGFLWPPIADALDTFLRRRHTEAASYERVWRLIHIWESIVITLATASMSRLIAEPGPQPVLKKQREFFYGKSWDPVTASFRTAQGACDGAIDQWINVLDEVSKSDPFPSRFLGSLQSFLTSERIDTAALVAAWSKACDVPTDFQSRGVVQVRVAMRYVNSLRNRLAHVPFPHDPLEDLSNALEALTEQLFSVDPTPESHEKDKRSSPLTGGWRIGQFFIHGSQLESLPQAEPTQGLHFVFPCQKKGEFETWLAGPFAHTDAMMRPHLLTRLKGRDVCEFTRFRAEANAIVVISASGISSSFPEPEKSAYATEPPNEQGDDGTPSIPTNMSEALEAIRSEDFDGGIAFFDKLVQSRPDYHIGWLRLGHARREKGVRLATGNPQDAIVLLRQALDDLGRAGGHSDPEYRAIAHYERSKTAFRLAQLDPSDTGSRTLIKPEATEACILSKDRKFQTWLDHVNEFGSWLVDGGEPSNKKSGA